MTTEYSTAAIAWRALLAALNEMELSLQADHPDETVQWALNELSDDGNAYLFASRNKVLDAYKAWKAIPKNDPPWPQDGAKPGERYGAYRLDADGWWRLAPLEEP